MKIKSNFLIMILAFIFSQCGGSSGTSSTDTKQLIVTLTDPSTITGLSGSDYEYQATLYLDANSTQGDSVYGPVTLSSYNADNNQYSSRIDNVLDGGYFLEVKLVKTASQSISSAMTNQELLTTENDLNLAQIDQEMAVSGTDTLLDLSSAEWISSTFDDDADGLSNLAELTTGTNPEISDTDSDGVLDSVDAFPINASESFDFDGDGIGDDVDNDIDNDGLTNSQEAALGTNSINADTDGDDIHDGADNCPLVTNSTQTDTDGDGLGDECDEDSDGDGLSNSAEYALGTDPNLSDTDADGVGDSLDAYPKNNLETTDTDSDGTGDNSDTDDDNDGLTDAQEVLLGTNSHVRDTDGDAIADNIDNCPIVSNPGQGDNDRDNTGDACDDDDDNDGLSDSEEAVIGTDGFVTNSLVADGDGDGFDDNADNCPTVYNVDQTQDADGDGFGAACDCNDNDPNINQLTDDSPDPALVDSNCDGIDGNKYEAIFVSPDGNATANNTDPSNPTSDVQGALEEARLQGYEVYFLKGDYNISSITLVDGVSLYGGFSDSFLNRDTTGDLYPTTLIQTATNVDNSVLSVKDFTQPITLSGFNFINQSTEDDQRLLEIENSSVTLDNNKFEGNGDIASETFVNVLSSEVTLTGNQFIGGASYQSLGFSSDSASGTLKNNIFTMGAAEHTRGIVLNSSDLIVSNNTIHGGAHTTGTAYGVIFSNSVPTILNNIFITQNDRAQAGVYCNGETPTHRIEIKNNLFLRYTTKSYQYAAYIDCSGNSLTTASALDSSSELSSDNNIVDANTNISQLVNILDVADYDKLMSGSEAINAGVDADSENKGSVVYDFSGNARTLGSYDIGANEF